MTNTSVEHHAAPLPAGTKAPDFELPSDAGPDRVACRVAGSAVILAFYPEDWSPVCSDQMGLYQELLPEFQKFEDFMSGVRSGVNGTPTFYLNGARHDGSYEVEASLAALDRAGGRDA
jgi:AhpC/TSA family